MTIFCKRYSQLWKSLTYAHKALTYANALDVVIKELNFVKVRQENV